MTKVTELVEQMESCEGCCDGEWQFRKKDAKEIINWWHEDGEYGEGETWAVVRLKDGRFGTFNESSDTTGHG